MYLDAQLLLSDAQAVTADAGSTNVVDLFLAAPQIGDGNHISVVMTVDVAADFTTGDETYVFVVQTDDNAAFSSAATVVSNTITAANLTAGSKHEFVIPPGKALERYIRLYYDVGGTTPSITATAFIQPSNMVQNYKTYPDGFTIS